jgi:thymidylate synthase
MFWTKDSFDDVLRVIFESIVADGEDVGASRGLTREMRGVVFEIKNPRCRLSMSENRGKVFSALGELLWYLSASEELEQIEYYIPAYSQESVDGKTIPGAYGPRIFGESEYSQIKNAIKLLRAKPSSRRAVVQIFSAKDLQGTTNSATKGEKAAEVPCTCTLQFFVRESRLHMVVYMRSSDAYLGLPHDVFAFTMIQEIVAGLLQIDLGTYRHAVGSLHLYKKHIKFVERYLNEGWQKKVPMPAMPWDSLEGSIDLLLAFEKELRRGSISDLGKLEITEYWKDLANLLRVHAFYRVKKYRKDQRESLLSAIEQVAEIRKQFASNAYDDALNDAQEFFRRALDKIDNPKIAGPKRKKNEDIG